MLEKRVRPAYLRRADELAPVDEDLAADWGSET
jgi:hypothetical protein